METLNLTALLRGCWGRVERLSPNAEHLTLTVNRAPAQELLLTLTTSGATQAQGVLCLWHQDR